MNFFKKSLTYLGHRILEGSLETDDSKIKVIWEWPVSKRVTDVRGFLGFTNYYHWFICKYAQVTWPSYKLIQEKTNKKNKSIECDDECWEAFRKLKEICTTTPILGYPDFSKPFKLHTDACTPGLGAILYQNQDRVDWIIGYASTYLNKTKHKYLAHKLEFLASKLAITEQFHEYLYGNNFVMFTDNNPLTYVLTSAKLCTTGHHQLLVRQL